jgi:hypothetical protein
MAFGSPIAVELFPPILIIFFAVRRAGKKFLTDKETVRKPTREIIRSKIMKQYKQEFTYLYQLQASGSTNMFGASAYVEDEFGHDKQESQKIVSLWMENWNQKDAELATK